jgi:hypothetical protein
LSILFWVASLLDGLTCIGLNNFLFVAESCVVAGKKNKNLNGVYIMWSVS